MYSFFVYTHTDYFDIWPLASESCSKYFKQPDYIFVNKEDTALKIWSSSPIFYNDKVSYSERLSSCLKQISGDVVLYTHEDFILYDKVKVDYLEYYSFLLKTDYDYIRLIKTGEMGGTEFEKGLWEIPKTSRYRFCVQASLWKKDKLIEFLDSCGPRSIWDLELSCQDKMDTYKGAYTYTQENKRGEIHFDSFIYPYMATAIVKGKWNSEYKKELLQLKALKNHDFNGRGWV